MNAIGALLQHILTILFLIGHPKADKARVIAATTLLKNKPKIWNVSQGEIGDGIIQTCKGLELMSGKA
jgi:hypothetical protein